MKNLTLLATALMLCTIAFAQTKDTTVTKKISPPEKPKVEYKLDNDKIITVQVLMKIRVGSLNSYLAVEQAGGPEALDNSDKLTGAQIQTFKKVYQSIKDSVNMNLYRQYVNFVKQDQAKFTADTTTKKH